MVERELIVKSIGLGMSADLTLLAPLRKGFVPSLESMTYSTRVKRMLAVLHGTRQASHEYAAARLLSDAVERVGVIHSVRVAVMQPESSVLLAVTFDGPWQAYLRVLWDKVGALLDLIFCNTEGYPLAWESSFEQWSQWVRRVQRETGFFFGPPSSETDLLFDQRIRRMRERRLDSDTWVDELRTVMPSAEEEVRRLMKANYGPQPDDPQLKLPSKVLIAAEQGRQALQALDALYRLTDLYVPDGGDGDVLRRAAIELLGEFVGVYKGSIHQDLLQQRERFARQLDWLCPGDVPPQPLSRKLPTLPDEYAIPQSVRDDVQSGILHQDVGVTHGALVLISFTSVAGAAAFLNDFKGQVSKDSTPVLEARERILASISFSPAGLRFCGMDEDTMAHFPEEFLQGMPARAGALGDVRNNHPRRWRLPHRFAGAGQPSTDELVDLAGVHAIVQLRCKATDAAALEVDDLEQPGHPLAGRVSGIAGLHADVRVVAVQSMRRRYRQRIDGDDVAIDHFGFVDGNGQPDLEWKAADPNATNHVSVGEVLWGHPNRVDSAPPDDDPRRPWMGNGTFLVVRKYRQFPDRLDQAVSRTAEKMAERGGDLADHRETVYAKLIGRRRDGSPLEAIYPDGDINAFDFDDDASGDRCPLHAHIRRANPRQSPAGSDRPPRIVRRGMSYGPAPEQGNDRARGLVFMTYNQSISEQFEVVQRWLAGGNSTGATSAVSCPVVGVPENGLERHYAFVVAAPAPAAAFDVALEEQQQLLDDPRPITQLEWGIYLFAPSVSALGRLTERASQAAAAKVPVPMPWEAKSWLSRAKRRIDTLLAIEGADAGIQAWKEVLEDPESIDREEAAALWSVIRKDHGGALDTPYGVLLADRDLILRVLRDDTLYSVSGQLERMGQSFGDIYLGLDFGADYRAQSAAMNDAIGSLDFDETYAYARDAAAQKITAIAQLAEQSANHGESRYETVFEAREVMDEVLAELTDQWFGLQNAPANLLVRGSADWAWSGGASLYPGHFTALSRNMFQPHPGPVAIDLARKYGQALRANMRAFVERCGAGNIPTRPAARGGPASAAPLATAAWTHLNTEGADFVGRQVTGVVMGYTPTIIGAALNVLDEWRRNDRFDIFRKALDGRLDAAAARKVLAPALQEALRTRPMPQITWRTARTGHSFEKSDGTSISVPEGRVIALGLVGGIQQALATGDEDRELMFGGVRQGESATGRGPTHACPGRNAGMAALFGSLVAFLTSRQDLREGPFPLTYSIQGPCRARKQVPAAVEGDATPSELDRIRTGTTTPMLAEAHVELPEMLAAFGGPAANPAKAADVILPWGDSWVSLDLGDHFKWVVSDLRDGLRGLGYTVPDDYADWTLYGTSDQLVYYKDTFCADLRTRIARGTAPKLILLSAGGNDSTKDALAALIAPKGQGPVLIADKVRAHVAGIEVNFTAVLEAIQPVVAGRGIGVIVHGYDHPIPNGKTNPFIGTDERSWLYDVFTRMNYAVGPAGADLAQATQAMKDLIDALNAMLIKLTQTFPFLRHVDLRGMVAAAYPENPAAGWFDDLHPNKEMFAKMAARIDELISAG